MSAGHTKPLVHNNGDPVSPTYTDQESARPVKLRSYGRSRPHPSLQS